MGRREGPSQALSTFCDQDWAGYFTHDFSSQMSSHTETRRLGEVTNLSRTQSEKTGRGGRHSSSLSPFVWQQEKGAAVVPGAGTTPEAGVRNRFQQEDIICTISLFTIPLSLLDISTQPLTHLILSFPKSPVSPPGWAVSPILPSGTPSPASALGRYTPAMSVGPARQPPSPS